MNQCPAENLLKDYHDGMLEDTEAVAIEAHLPECERCRSVLDKFRKTDLRARIIRQAISFTGSQYETISDATGLEEVNLARDWPIPDYEKVRLCGEGAFGTVWVVRDRVGLNRALKAIDLRSVRAARAGSREMAALESYCRIIDEHLNLVRVYHVGIHGPFLYYIMELADDAATNEPARRELPDSYSPLTLRWVLRKRPLKTDTAMEIGLRLLRGLVVLHDAGLAHRDIKPANIIFVNGHPKLADIGMVTIGDPDAAKAGTPAYMPPDMRMDATADVFAMGTVIYEMMAGEKPGEQLELPDIILEGSLWWDMPAVQKCLQRARAPRSEDRYANARHLLEDIESCRSFAMDVAEQADSPPKRPATLDPWARIAIAAVRATPWIFGLWLAYLLILDFLVR